MAYIQDGAFLKYKIVFVGDQSVGKTSIIQRFVSDKFSGIDKVHSSLPYLPGAPYPLLTFVSSLQWG